ncbi:MAG: toluene tolerance protein [Betaproteobacteria bacterium]|nr:toluene tolerance protein [Betaproteobacteria bacterium]
MREGAEVLEADPHGDKVLRLADGTILKLFRRKRLISSAALYPYAQRFANNAAALEKLDIPVPKIIAVMRISELSRDVVHYAPLAGSTLRELARAGLSSDRKHRLKEAFTQFVIYLHDKGVYFRSLHIGNIVCTPDGQLGLIDFSDLRIHPWPLGKYLRARNMRRMQGIADELDWLDLDAIVKGRVAISGASI